LDDLATVAINNIVVDSTATEKPLGDLLKMAFTEVSLHSQHGGLIREIGGN
jgi:hypothetical protein